MFGYSRTDRLHHAAFAPVFLFYFPSLSPAFVLYVSFLFARSSLYGERITGEEVSRICILNLKGGSENSWASPVERRRGFKDEALWHHTLNSFWLQIKLSNSTGLGWGREITIKMFPIYPLKQKRTHQDRERTEKPLTLLRLSRTRLATPESLPTAPGKQRLPGSQAVQLCLLGWLCTPESDRDPACSTPASFQLCFMPVGLVFEVSQSWAQQGRLYLPPFSH